MRGYTLAWMQTQAPPSLVLLRFDNASVTTERGEISALCSRFGEVAYIDFRYTLLTRAGFEVVRKGMASAQVASGAVVGLVIATTEQRYKGLEDDIRASVDSFRAYPVKLDDPLLASM